MTLDNIKLNYDNWTDLNTESGIIVGTSINIQMISSVADVLIVQSPTIPDANPKGYNLLKKGTGFGSWLNSGGGDKLWAKTTLGNATINVQEA